MKRLNNLYHLVYSKENLILADQKARKGKSKRKDVIAFDENKDANIEKLHVMLKEKTYRTSEYKVFPVSDPKERMVYQLPYFPDRIAHYAIMNVLEDMFTAVFTSDSYSCIPGRGIHGAFKAIKKVIT